LFLWTAAIALSLVALRSASATWVAVSLLGAMTVLTSSVLLAIYRRGARRAYWVGFATFGCLYLLLPFASWTLAQVAATDNLLASNNLPTQQLSSATYHWLYDKAFEKYYASQGGGYAGSAPGMGMSSGMDPYGGPSMMPTGWGMAPTAPPGPNERDFVHVAHAVWTLLLATLGGCLAYWIYRTGPGRSDPALEA
jgi:hypothetical protein